MSVHPSDDRLPRYILEVARVKVKQSKTFRILSTPYKGTVAGLFTHHAGKPRHGQLCREEHCPPADHRLPKIWKGYLSAEEWLPHKGYWVARTLEITERCELDMRDRIQRGQVWELSCLELPNKTHPPVRGRLLEQIDPDKLPQAVDVLDNLWRLYHHKILVLDQVNPLPPLSALIPSLGSPPRDPEKTSDNAPRLTPEEMAEFRRRVGIPEPKPNGRHATSDKN